MKRLSPYVRALACCGSALLVMMALPSCRSQSGNPTGAGLGASPRGTLRIALQSDVKTLNPLLATATPDIFVQRFMFEPLISANHQANPVPILVTQVPSLQNGGVSRDGLTITYKLRPNMHWTDGVRVTSKDVKFSWSAIVNPANNVITKHGYDVVASIDTPNALTAVVHLKRPLASFINTFFAESDAPYTVVPEHVLGKEPNINRVSFNEAPTVSDGPFKFVRWQHGDRVVLTANDGFFMGKPKLAGVTILTVPNENTGGNMIRSGAVDYMFQASITTYPQLHGAPGVQLVFNNVNGYEGMAFNNRRAPMSDPRVRTAIAYAIDKERLVRDLTYGQEKIATEDLPDWMWANNPSLRPLPHDVSKARALLAQAGVKTPLSLLLVTDAANVTHRRAAVLVQSMLRDIGINLEVKTYPADLLYASQAAGGILNNGKFDLALWPWYGGLDPDNSSEFSCENIPPHGWNTEGYCNPQMQAQQNIALTHYDQPTREAAYHRIEALIARDNPALFFWWNRQQEPIRTAFHGFAPNPVIESWNAWEWSLSPS